MTDHKIGTSEEWLAAREKLVEREKEYTRLGDELARQRRELPWVRVEKEYRFETVEGTKTLAELFGGRSQLLIYHFMFRSLVRGRLLRLLVDCRQPRPERRSPGGAGRNGGALIEGAAREAPGLQAADVLGQPRLGLNRRRRLPPRPRLPAHRGGATAVPGGRDPAEVVQNARVRGTDVAGHVSEGPGLSVYFNSDGIVYRTCVTTARGVEPAMGYYGLLDRTPMGRSDRLVAA
jgi:predicted dithiol-disulfide oxidoreductase (DUF899 family)